MATAADKVCRIIHSVTALLNDGALVAKINGRVVSLFLTAPRVSTTGPLVEVVLTADVR